MAPMKATQILMVAASSMGRHHLEGMLHFCLETTEPGVWSSTVSCRTLFHDAVSYIQEHPSLQLVYISDEYQLYTGYMREGCAKLAKALAAHPAQPSVVLADSLKLGHLILEFEALGVQVLGDVIYCAVCDRWASQHPTAPSD